VSCLTSGAAQFPQNFTVSGLSKWQVGHLLAKRIPLV
jgi:hypothetical protein